jgi:uncharacterized protein YeaO (DUF488 family)
MIRFLIEKAEYLFRRMFHFNKNTWKLFEFSFKKELSTKKILLYQKIINLIDRKDLLILFILTKNKRNNIFTIQIFFKWLNT